MVGDDGERDRRHPTESAAAELELGPFVLELQHPATILIVYVNI
jgi:hypothetical protein